MMKDHTLRCHECKSDFLVREYRAKRGECPNCHELNTTRLD